MDLAQVEKLLELMHRYGCIQAKVQGLELTLDPTRPLPVAEGSLAPPVEEKQVTGEEPRPSRLNPLLRNKSLGLGQLLVEPDKTERQVAP